MPASPTLIDWILDLFRDPHARAAFQANPQRYAAEHGFDQVTARDVHDALCVAADHHPAHSSRDDDDDHDKGGHHHKHLSSPPEPHHHESASKYLDHYITNNFTTVIEHNTNIDQSVHQTVDTHGGAFNQVIDNDPVVASGDGAVAARGDIQGSTLTTGSHNVVGDDNAAATGDGGTTAFGTGSANNAELSHVSTGDGSGLSFGGDSYGHATDNTTSTAVHGEGSGDTTVSAAGPDAQSAQYADQSAHDNSAHNSYDDSSRTLSNDTYNSHNSDRYDDSHNETYHH